MMRSGGRRGNFRGTVESPFLRHRFTDARQDNLLPSLREAAAALCRNADRETLVEVVKLLEGADPRNRLARRAALQFVKDEPRTPAPAPRLPPPPPRNQQLANRETQALAAMPPPPPPSSQTSPTRSSLTTFLGEAASNAASSISEAATSLLRTPSVEARQVRTASEDQQNDRETRVRRRVDEFIKREGDSLKRSASTPSLSQRSIDVGEESPASPSSPPLTKMSASCAMLQQLNITASQARVKLGLDLGGSLTKLVIATPLEDTDTPTTPRTNKPHLRVACDVNGVRTRLQFVSAATDELEEVLAALGCSDAEDEDEERRSFNRASRRIVAAGGGAHKLRRTFRSALGIEFKAFPEMQSVVDGLLLLHELNVPDEVYTASGGEAHEIDIGQRFGEPARWPQPLLPLLLVNVGSGVSCLVVNKEGYTRVGGTALGGASFLGLARALTSATTYREALALAARGDSSEVDTLVEDIYGSTGCVDLGLPPSLTAASFGKLARQGNRSARDEDVCRALLEMVAQSCCVLARAHAAQWRCQERVFFAGGFLDENPLARATIANSLKSLGSPAHFLRHSDFLGALGATAHALDHDHQMKLEMKPGMWAPGHSPPPRRRQLSSAADVDVP